MRLARQVGAAARQRFTAVRALRVMAALLAFGLAPIVFAQQPTPQSARQPVCPPGPVALVLSGGGAKGIAHVGVLQHLDSLGVRPDLVVGTSMGAVVGGMYASGWSSADLERFVFRFNVGRYIGGYTPSAPRSLGAVLPLVTWKEGDGGSLDFSTSTVREANVNFIVTAMMLAGNLRAAGDFDRLPIPFRAVATDLSTGDAVVLRDGDLAEAVRASFAIPLVFPPVTIDGRVLVDGGVASNEPVQLARDELAPGALTRASQPPRLVGSGVRVILSEMVDSVPVVIERGTTGAVASSLLRFLFTQRPAEMGAADRVISSNTTGVSPLDFSEATMRSLLERGRQAAREAIPDATCLPTGSRIPGPLPSLAARRYAERPSTAAFRVAQSLLARIDLDRVPVDTLMDRIARLGSSELANALWLHPSRDSTPTTASRGVARTDSVLLSPDLVFAPERTVAAGLVYDGELGGRAWVGAVDRRPAGVPVELAVRGALGRFRQDALLGLRRSEQNIEVVRSPFLELIVARERLRQFADGDGEVELPDASLPTFTDEQVRLGVEQPLGARWTLQAAGLGRRVTTIGVTSDSTVGARPLYVLGGIIRLVRVRSDPSFVPRFEIDYTNRYTRVLAASVSTFRWRGMEFLATTRAVWGDREQPLVDATTLGGDGGMAGLPIYARRGRTELSAALDVGRALVGPITVQTTLMGGQVSADERRPVDGARIAGVRLGVGASTPVGPVRVQYGTNTDGRRAWYVRFGRWF
jgi:predicted acylesterase/phospholipase RssA